MRKHRFFTQSKITIYDTITLDIDLSHQITRVLRLKAQDSIFLFNNSGYEYTAIIQTITRNAVDVHIVSQAPDLQESSLQIHLAQVIAKGDKMEFVIQKATELGIHTITPLISERTVVKKIKEKAEHKLDHWYKIAISASCQSWRNYVPIINEPQDLTTWLQNTNTDHKLILSTAGTSKRIKDLTIKSPITILIGPEGGFSDEELNLALNCNFQAISLGPRILRTETAGLATIAILQSMLGDL